MEPGQAAEYGQRGQRSGGRELEERAARAAGVAVIGNAPSKSRSIDIAIRALGQPIWLSTTRTGGVCRETVERGKSTARGNLKHCAFAVCPALECGPVEFSVVRLNESSSLGRPAVRLVESVQRSQFASGGYFKDSAPVVGPASGRYAVKVPVGGQH